MKRPRCNDVSVSVPFPPTVDDGTAGAADAEEEEQGRTIEVPTSVAEYEQIATNAGTSLKKHYAEDDVWDCDSDDNEHHDNDEHHDKTSSVSASSASDSDSSVIHRVAQLDNNCSSSNSFRRSTSIDNDNDSNDIKAGATIHSYGHSTRTTTTTTTSTLADDEVEEGRASKIEQQHHHQQKQQLQEQQNQDGAIHATHPECEHEHRRWRCRYRRFRCFRPMSNVAQWRRPVPVTVANMAVIAVVVIAAIVIVIVIVSMWISNDGGGLLRKRGRKPPPYSNDSSIWRVNTTVTPAYPDQYAQAKETFHHPNSNSDNNNYNIHPGSTLTKDPNGITSTLTFQTLIDRLGLVIIESSHNRSHDGHSYSDPASSSSINNNVSNNDCVVVAGSPQYQALVYLSSKLDNANRHHDDEHVDVDFSKDTKIAVTSSSSSPPPSESSVVIPLTYRQLVNRYVLLTIFFAWNGKEWKQRHPQYSASPLSSLPSSLSPNNNKDRDDTMMIPIEGWVQFDGQPSTVWYYDITTVDSICFWTGVGCFMGEESIVTIDLHDMDGLRGQISTVPEVASLSTSLQVLDLSHNKLKGPIPNSWDQLTNLRRLSLHDNHLSGLIPPLMTDRSHMPNLVEATFHHNDGLLGLHSFGSSDLSSSCESSPAILTSDCAGTTTGHPNLPPLVMCPCCTMCCAAVLRSDDDSPQNDGLQPTAMEFNGTSWIPVVSSSPTADKNEETVDIPKSCVHV